MKNRELRLVDHMKSLDIVFNKMPKSIMGIYRENIVNEDGVVKSRVSYSYLTFMLRYLLKHGIVQKKKSGRDSIYRLTEKGIKIHENVKNIIGLMDDKDDA